MARIRELTRADLELAGELLEAEHLLHVDRGVESRNRLLEASLGRETIFLAEEDSVLSGLVCFYPEPFLANGGYVRFLVVRPDRRRRGIGRQLIGFVERKTTRRTSDMYFCVSSDNETGINFLARMGYVKDTEISPSPTVLTRWLVMRKCLEPADRRRLGGSV